MAGVIRIGLGILLLLIGLAFLASIVGILLGLLLIVVGIVLIASGASARGDAERMRRQQEQTNLLLQQQIQLSAMQAQRSLAQAPYPAAPASTGATALPNLTSAQSDKYCPACGQRNARISAFCANCGQPLPPPS